jgi:hypothetical protein
VEPLCRFRLAQGQVDHERDETDLRFAPEELVERPPKHNLSPPEENVEASKRSLGDATTVRLFAPQRSPAGTYGARRREDPLRAVGAYNILVGPTWKGNAEVGGRLCDLRRL